MSKLSVAVAVPQSPRWLRSLRILDGHFEFNLVGKKYRASLKKVKTQYAKSTNFADRLKN